MSVCGLGDNGDLSKEEMESSSQDGGRWDRISSSETKQESRFSGPKKAAAGYFRTVSGKNTGGTGFMFLSGTNDDQVQVFDSDGLVPGLWVQV